jgi:hypothetical protein
MSKKTLGIILVVAVVAVAGVAYLVYQGGSKNGAGGTGVGNLPGEGENTGIEIPQGGEQGAQKDPYSSAEEIAAPAGLPSELKSIFSGICGGVKLTILDYNFPTQGVDTLVYVWKNKPTEEKLRNAFEKNEYVIEELGNGLLNLKKGNLYIVIDYGTPDREEGQEIVVLSEHE